MPFLHCALSLAAQCIVIGPAACLQRAGGRRVFVCLWVCYHDNSKLRVTTPNLVLIVQLQDIARYCMKIANYHFPPTNPYLTSSRRDSL